VYCTVLYCVVVRCGAVSSHPTPHSIPLRCSFLQDAQRHRIGSLIAVRHQAALSLAALEAWRRVATRNVLARMFLARHQATVALPKALGAWLHYRLLRRQRHQRRMRVCAGEGRGGGGECLCERACVGGCLAPPGVGSCGGFVRDVQDLDIASR
jgi:hypothetical protein